MTIAARPALLTAKEYRTLSESSASVGQTLTYGDLRRRIRGPNADAEVRPSLRRKLGDDAENPTYIFTEPRVR